MRFLVAGVMIMTICAVSSSCTVAASGEDPAVQKRQSAEKNQPAEKTRPAKQDQPADERATPVIDPDRAFGYLAKICAIGPRISGSEGMDRQQQLIQDHFTKLKVQ